MNMRKKFIISNIIMLVAPILLIAVITFLFVATFIITYPTYAENITLIDLLDPSFLISTLGGIIKENPSAVKYIFLWILCSLLIIIGVITINTIILSHSILHPIRELTKAVEYMKHGNLDVDIMRTSDEEIDKLCIAFDEMRIKLKEGREQEQFHINERKMLLANLSHDLRTPITSIKGYIQGIQDGIADTPEKMNKYLSTIASKATVIESMVDNMSLFAKLETDRLQFDFELGNINDLLKQLIEEYQLDFNRNNITFDINLCDTPAIVKLDFQKMRRVFSNLIENAIKYKKDDNGHISVTSEVKNSGVFITVSDSGIGIKNSDLNRIFEGFYRSDPSRNLNVKGNGLGLGIAKQITEKHGGKIWAKSENGEGTTIFIYLPSRA